jgi:exopolysaccharide biosynthesis polyprenyl glycosylphosphotransferase
MREKLRKLIVLFQSILLLVFHGGTFTLIWHSYFVDVVGYSFWDNGYLVLLSLYIFLLYVFIRLFGGNRLGFNRVSDVIFTNTMALVFTNVFIYTQMSLIARLMLPLYPLFKVIGLQFLFVFAWSILSKNIYIHYFPPTKMLMILGENEDSQLKRKIQGNAESFDIHESVRLSQGMDVVLERLKHYRDVIISDVPSQYRNQILKECYRDSKRVFMTPKISDIIIRGSLNIHLFDTPLLLSNNRGLKLEQRVLKRTFDVVASFLAIIILTIPFLIIALLIKLHDQGPVFYTQERLTINGQIFQIIKFRSMHVHSESDNVARLASKDDDRITPIGKILRLTHVDELPQLFNILKGDMSLVGPRPERPDIAAIYEESIPEFSYRLKVKAGLSGYAQVFGQYNTTPADKLKLDLFYIENYSFIRDIHIILLTVKIMFMKEKSEGLLHAGMTALVEPSQNKES